MKMNKPFLMILILIVLTILIFELISADIWYPGSLHQHTGYSTIEGYDGNPDTDSDNCLPIGLELNFQGYTVAELAEDAGSLGLRYLGFSDHSYCVDSSEFNTVEVYQGCHLIAEMDKYLFERGFTRTLTHEYQMDGANETITPIGLGRIPGHWGDALYVKTNLL